MTAPATFDQYFAVGMFVDFGGVDKSSVTNAMNSFLLGQSMNQPWRTQKIFIMDGGACGDGQGNHSGPAAYGVSVKNVAWYLLRVCQEALDTARGALLIRA